jgi:hypothetical protein
VIPHQTRYYIAAMDCPTEEQILRNGLKNHPAIAQLDVDLVKSVFVWV